MLISVDRPTATTRAQTTSAPPERRTHAAKRTPRRLSPRWLDAAAAVAALGGAVAVLRLLWASPNTRTPTENTSDEAFFEWMLIHAVRIFSHGENPFRSTTVNVPDGVNLLANTHALGLTIPMVPVTVLLGPAVAFVLMSTIGMAGTAYAWYHVLSRHLLTGTEWTRRIGALAGAALCGFGPGMMAQANGHPNLTAQFLVPFMIWRVMALRESTRVRRDGVILGLLITYQATINEEVLLYVALAMFAFLTAYAIFRRSVVRRFGPKLLRGVGIAAALSGVLLGYPLWLQFTAPGHVGALPASQEHFPYTLPLASYARLPTLSTWGSPLANNVLAEPPEENSFLGWPLLIAVALVVIALWRNRVAVRALLLAGLLFVWGSLGNQVIISDPDLAYPYALWDHLYKLPILSSVLPTRLALVVLDIVAVLVAIGTTTACNTFSRSYLSTTAPERLSRIGGNGRGLRATIVAQGPSRHVVRLLRLRVGAAAERAAARMARRRRLLRASAIAGLVAICAALVALVPCAVPATAATAVPRFFTDGTYRQYVPAGYSLLSATPEDGASIDAWAAATKLDLPLVGGYFFAPDSHGRARYGPRPRSTTTLLGELGADKAHLRHSPTRRAAVVDDLRYWHVSVIVLVPGEPYDGFNVMQGLERLFGPVRWVDGVWLWDVQPITDGPIATYRGISGWSTVPLPLSLR